MSYEELLEYIAYPDTCYPEFLELAKRRLEEQSSIPGNEMMKSLANKYLDELEEPCEESNEGESLHQVAVTKGNTEEKKTMLPLKEWKKAISLMSKDELQFILDRPGSDAPEYLKIVETNYKKLSLMPENEAMKVVVKRNLEEMGCPCKIDEEGDLHFFFQGESFYAILRKGNHYIDIFDYNWNTIKLSDTDEVRRLKHAINETNGACRVTTYYNIDEDKKTINVSCCTSIPYSPMITNVREHLYDRLSSFFYAHHLVNAEMTLMAERENGNDSEQNLFNTDNLPIC
ncbi:MAG: hypothetical protein K6B13_10925 [Prevotella sp.]|nr:hypothetical protein [Prevotella sp.]